MTQRPADEGARAAQGATTAPDAAQGQYTHHDTQWPRWEVLKQDNERKQHQAVGSVHAADPEHALLMARTVFARRPSAISMWVAPVSAIASWTAEELERRASVAGKAQAEQQSGPQANEHEAAPTDGQPRRYLVVRKSSNRRSMTFGELVGEVEGANLDAALDAALERFSDEPVLALWLVDTEAVVRSDPEEADPWFGPALDKTYKQQSVYSSRATASKDASKGVPR